MKILIILTILIINSIYLLTATKKLLSNKIKIKEYRNLSLSREFLLPAEKQFAIDNSYDAIALSFNDFALFINNSISILSGYLSNSSKQPSF